MDRHTNGAGRTFDHRVQPGGCSQWQRSGEIWAHQDSNLERAGYEPAALTVELWARIIIADCSLPIADFPINRRSAARNLQSTTTSGLPETPAACGCATDA